MGWGMGGLRQVEGAGREPQQLPSARAQAGGDLLLTLAPLGAQDHPLPALRSPEARPRTIYSKSEDRERGAPAMENLPFHSLGSSQEERLKMQV